MNSPAGLPAGGARSGAVARPVLRRDGMTAAAASDLVAEEVPVALLYNDEPFAVMLASPLDLEDFGVGFSISEGLVASAEDIVEVAVDETLAGLELRIRLRGQPARLQSNTRTLPGYAGCGLCGVRQLEEAVRWPAPVQMQGRSTLAAIHRAVDAMPDAQALHRLTGATHAAGWFALDGEMLLVREDIGRHNALDKLIGGLARAGLDPAQGMLVMTSRASCELLQKAGTAGIGLMAAVSAPTALAISIAESANLTLLGFVRGQQHVIYTHPWRVGEA